MELFRLAPLCGVTDWPFRSLCAEQGCEVGYTEMVSAMGFLCAPEGQPATYQLLERGPAEKKLILQLFGRDPDTVARAAAILSATGKYDGIDLNMGCPAHKIAPSGEGCGLMRTPDIAFSMMKKTVHASAIPVSVKMRLGWDSDSINVVQIARLAEEAGVKEITIHGRTRTQQYSGFADWDIISEVKKKVSIPVIGNGDLITGQQCLDYIKKYGVDGVMVGRGAMGNPWIFREIKDALNGKTPRAVTNKERADTIRKHYEMMLSWKTEYIAVREMRKHIGWYLHGLRGASQTRVKINRIDKAEEALSETLSFLAECGEE